MVHVKAGGIPNTPGEPYEESKSMQVVEVEQRNCANVVASEPEEVVEYECYVLVSLTEVADNSSTPWNTVGVEPHVVVLTFSYSFASNHEVNCVVEEIPAAVVSHWEQELFLEVEIEIKGDKVPF